VSSSRWARSNEQGSAFPVTRGRGRGRGGNNVPRGGRGGGRGGGATRDSKPESTPRQADARTAESPSVSTASVPTMSTASSDKAATRSKPPPRQSSRPAGPPIVTNSVNPVESGPPSARSKSRKKRSNAGKQKKINEAAAEVEAKAEAEAVAVASPITTPTQSLPPPAPPKPVPVKDTPPHLLPKSSAKTDLDAFVERTRAAAMDLNRPSTPKTHIDWALDDDDSLPDLDDWGVNPATFSSSKSEIISPIIVDGLKTLPDLTLPSNPTSPLRHVVDVEAVDKLPEVGPTPSVSTSVQTRTAGGRSQINDQRKALHLPSKPTPIVQSKPRGSGTPLRNAFPKSPLTNEVFNVKKPETKEEDTQTPVPPPVQTDDKPKVAETAQVQTTVPERQDGPQPVAETISKRKTEDPLFGNLGGLYESIHAPKPSESGWEVQEPQDGHRKNFSHTRAHTVGRPPVVSGQDQNARFNNYRGANPLRDVGGGHTRYHSSPAVSNPGRRPPHHNRPVIRADALNRIAQTIGKTNSPKGGLAASLED